MVRLQLKDEQEGKADRKGVPGKGTTYQSIQVEKKVAPHGPTFCYGGGT